MYGMKIVGKTLKYALGLVTGEVFSIPEEVEEIADGAFASNIVLKSIRIGPGVRKIGNRAFLGCTALESVFLPSTLDSVGDEAFSGCTNLKKFSCEDRSKTRFGKNCWRGCVNLSECVIGDDTGKIFVYPSGDLLIGLYPQAFDNGVVLYRAAFAGPNFPSDPPATPNIYVASAMSEEGREYWWYGLNKEDAIEGAYLQANHETIRGHFGELTLDTCVTMDDVSKICGFCPWGVASFCDAFKIDKTEPKKIGEVLEIMRRYVPGAARRFVYVLEHQDSVVEVLDPKNLLSDAALMSERPTSYEKLTYKW